MRGWAVARLLAAGLLLLGGAASAQETPGASCAGVTANAEVCHDSYCVKCISNTWTLQALRTGASSATCDSTISGTIRLNGTALEYCNSTSWVSTGGAASADSLDFTEFKDAMVLDASTDIAVSGSNVLSITNTGSGNSLVVNDAASDTTPFIINALGNVGIGTTDPDGELHVHSSGVESNIAITAGGAAGFYLGTDNTGWSWLWNAGAGGISVGTDDTDAMSILASGEVGIGTTNPGSKLDVKGTLRLSGSTSGYVGLAPAAAAGSTTYTLPAADGTNGQFLKTNGSGTLSWGAATAGAAGSDTQVQFNDGGTTLGGDSGLTYNKTTDALTAAGLVTGAGFAPTASTATGNRLYLPTTNTLGLAINGSGEVQLTGTALSPVTNDGNALGTTALKWSDLHLASGAVINFNNGDVTVTHSANTLAFAGASSGYTFDTNVSAVTVTVTSDRRYKTNIEPLVDKLKPVSYELKDSKEQVRHIGFVAQDVEEILPQLVETQDNAEKKKGLRYDEFIPVLTKAIQELKARNDNLKAANEELVARLAKLEAAATKAE